MTLPPHLPDMSTLVNALLRGYETDIGDAASSSFTIAHGLGKSYPAVVVVKNTPYSAVAGNLFTNPILAANSTGWTLSTGTGGGQGNVTTAARAAMPDVGSDFGFHVVATKNDDTLFGGFGPASTPVTLMAVTPGLPYSVSGLAYGVAAPPDVSGGGWRAEILWYDSSQALLSTSTGNVVPGTTGVRQRVTMTATAPASAAYAQVKIRAITRVPSALVDFYVTGLVFVQSASVPLSEKQESCDVTYVDANTLIVSSEAWTASPPALNAYHVAVGT